MDRHLSGTSLAVLCVVLGFFTFPLWVYPSSMEGSDVIQEGSLSHQFDIDVIINLAVGNSANQPGNMDRWTLALAVQNNNVECASSAVTLTPAQSGIRIPSGGQGIITGVTANIDLTGCLCSAPSAATQLKVTLTSTTYTLTPLTPSGTSAITCNGLLGITLTLKTSNADLVENGDMQSVTLTVVGNSESQGRSVVCTSNCWSVDVYIASGDWTSYTPIASTRVTAIVPASGTSWLAGDTFTLSGVTATLNLNNVGSCNSIDLLCTSLYRNPSSIPVFSVGGVTIDSCTPVVCTGVLINQVIPAFTNPTWIKQGEDNPGLELTVTIKADDTKASIAGTGLWQTAAFGNANANCLHPTQVPATINFMEGTDYGLNVNFQSVWSMVVVSLNMAQHGCNDAQFICIEVQKGSNPSPDFSLSFSPESAKYGAIAVGCKGLVVDSGSLTVHAATHLAAFKEDHAIQFDARFISKATSGGVGGTDLWELVVFPAFNSDGLGTKGPETIVPLQTSQLNTAFPGNGGFLTFQDLTATISLVGNRCGTYRYLCSILKKKSTANPDFTITSTPGLTVCSQMLNCQNVILTSTVVSPSGGQSPNGLPLYEGVNDQDIYFDLVSQSDQTAGSVPSGINHWQFTVTPGANVLADPTQAQRDMTLTAGETLTFTRILATLDLTNQRCATLGDVCAEVMRSGADTLGFVLDSGSAQNMGCFTPTCQGVEITSLVINNGVTNFALKEGTQDHTMTFSVSVTSNADAGSVRGSNLWKMLVYLSMDNTKSLLVSSDAILGAWASQDVLAGVGTTLSNVQVSLDLDTTCANMQFLCIELDKADGQTFLLDPALNTLKTCKPVPGCNGVEVASTDVAIDSGGPLVEGVSNNAPVVVVSLTFTDTSASVTGSNVWSVTIYGSNNADGIGSRIAQQMSTTSGNSAAGATVPLDGITWNVDMTNLLCVEVTYICVEVKLVAGATFSLLPSTNGNCSPVECEGIVIISEDFTLDVANIFEAKGLVVSQTLTTTQIRAQAAGNGAEIADNAARIWAVSLFLNSAPDGSGQTFATATPTGSLPSADQFQGISSTNPLRFSGNLQFEFTLNVLCGPALYACLEISEQADASPDYDITFPANAACKEISCTGVVFSSADLAVPANTVLIENEQVHPVVVTFRAETAPVTATLQTGSNFWLLSVFANTQADGSGAERYGEATAFLNRAQISTPALVSDMVELAGVTANLNLDGFVCPSDMIYLCAELKRNPASNPPFTIQGTPSPLVACERVECQGVLITSIGIAGLPPAVIENEVNPLRLTVTAGVGGADASGTNLWRMNASIVYNGMVLAAEEVNLGVQANADVVAGQPVTFSDLAVPFDLRGLVCPGNGTVMLCLQLSRAGSANTDFTVTGVTKQCEELPCLGVVIIQSAVRGSTGSLLESRASNDITLDLSYSSDADGASISGNALWSIVVFGNNQEDGLGTRMAETTGVLQGNDVNFPLPKGETVEFNNVDASLNLNPYLVCEEVRWVCAELTRGTNRNPDFSLTDTNNARIACTSLNCRGVQILSTTLVINNIDLREDSGNQLITVAGITLRGAPGSSMLPSNDENFKVVIFGNSKLDTSGPKVAEAVLDVSFSQRHDIAPNADTTLTNSFTTLNLTDVFCADLKYLCVQVYRGDTRTFKLEGVPDENSLIDCAPVTCKGVRVTSGNVEAPSILREGNPDYPVNVTVEFTTDINGASVRAGGSDLFKLVAFLAATADGGAPITPDQDVTLPQGSESQTVPAGTSIAFVQAVAMLNTTNWTCLADNFLCIRLLKDPLASFNYLLEGWDTGTPAVDPTKLQTCVAIDCRGVSITDVVFQTDQMLSFQERDSSATFTVDLGLVADPNAGGVIGTGLWKLTFSLNSAADGNGDSFGTETVATLSAENANRAVDPSGPRTNLTDIGITLPGVHWLLCSQASSFYLCVKVEKADGSSPDFTLTVGGWSCTEITCYPVRISDVSFKVTTPSFIRENDDNFLHIDLNVTTDALSASISGERLWASPSFAIQYTANPMTLASTGGYWTLPLQNMGLGTGETTEFINLFPVTLTPDGVVCSQLSQLCMTFAKGTNPNPEFGLQFLAPSQVCMDIDCRGVEIVSTVISSIVTGDTVTERKPNGQDVTVTVTSASAVAAASIAGTNLWAVTLYYTPNANGDVDATIGSAQAVLTQGQMDTGLVAGQDLVLENVMKASLNVMNLVCPKGDLWLCARLEKHANPTPLFTLSALDGDSSALIGCRIVTCIGVEIEETAVDINNGMLIPVEKAPSHIISFYFTSTPSLRSADLSGTGLWKLTAFANRREDGSHHRRSYEVEVILTSVHMNSSVIPGLPFIFSNRMVDLNLLATDTECRETPFFCGQLLKGDNPSPQYSLQGSPDDSALINCKPLDCNGVKISTFDLTSTGSGTLHENEDNQRFSFDVALMSALNKESVEGTDLWTFRAYINNAADCLGDAEEVALTNTNVRPFQEDQNLPAGGTINFNVDVSMDYQMMCPAWSNVYICLEVFVGDSSTEAFTLFGDIVKGVEIECRGVEVTNTDINTVNLGSLIIESDNDVTFDLNLRISSNSDAEGSSISGTGLWSVDIYISDTESCQTATTDRVTSTLTMFNRDKPLSAGAVLLLNRVRATIPLRDTLCEDINYVCAELAKGPSPSPNFTLVPLPDETSLLASVPIECKGLHILSTGLTLEAGEPLISNDPQHPVAFEFAFETDPEGASILNPMDLFRLQVAATDSPTRAGVLASGHQVIIPYTPPPGFNIAAGQLYTIMVDADLNLRGAKCDEIPYICVTLMKGLNAEPPFTLTPDNSGSILTACSERLDCIGVRVVNEWLAIESGIPFLEHAVSNPVELTVSLTADQVSGNAIGNSLWSAEVKLSLDDPLAPGTDFFAVTTGTFVGNDASESLEKGQTIELRLAADLNLGGLSCSDVRYLIVNITNPNANPEFTLEWRAGGPEYVVVTKLFTCSGVSLDTVSLSVANGFPLLELAPTNDVTVSVGIEVTATSATVTGTDLWKVTAFVSSDPNGIGTPEDEKVDAVLTSAQGAVPIIAGMVSPIYNVEVTLDTSGKYCSDMTYVCVEVWRGDSAQPYYNIQSPANQAGLRSCVPTQCNGVQIMAVTPTIISIPPVIEMRPNQVVVLDLNVTATPDSAGIVGDNLWAATVFGSSLPDGSGPRASERMAVIDPSQSSKDLDPGSVLTLEDLVATMDFTGVSCSQMAYICVMLDENAQAQPNFNLGGGRTSCVMTNCISVAIASGSLTLVSNEVLEGDDLAMFTLDASFLPWFNSRSLQEDDSWLLHAYTTDRGDGLGVAYTISEVTLTSAQQNQGVVIGTPLTFNNRDVTLDLSAPNCESTTHLCVVLSTQLGVSFVLGGYPTPTSLVACAELQCFSGVVNLYPTEVTETRIRVEFTEAYGDFDLYVLTYSPSDGITTSPFSIPRNLQRQLDFNQLVPGQEYTIQLTLRDGTDQKGGPFETVVRTRPDDVILQLDSVTSSELTVSWDAATGIFDHYTIHLEPSDAGLPRTPLDVYPNEDREVTFTGLLTARQYNVTIYTVSGASQSLPSSVIANTDPSTPFLLTTGNDETTVDLEWSIDRGYIVDRYEISYQPADSRPQPLIFPPTTTATTLEDLVPGRMYDISLVAVSNIGGVVVIRSSPAEVSVHMLPAPPAEITYSDSTESSVRITWPSAEGDLDYYNVVFSPSEERIVLKNAPREVLFQGLAVASEYTVTITTHVAGVNGILVSQPVQRTVYTLPYPPGPLEIVEVTTTTIEFQWQDATGPRDGYEVIFDPNEPEFVPQSPYFTTSNTMLLTGIKPHVTVDFEVRTKIGDVVSRPQLLRQRTFPTLPGRVRDFQIDGYDTDNIQISFKVPEDPNGLILAYLVSVEGTKPGQPSETAFQTITALPNDVQFEEIISPLKAGYTYTLSIQAANTEGSGEPVVLAPVTLPIREPYYTNGPLISENFILSVTSSTITIRVPSSLFSDRNGKVTAYSILVVEVGANQTASAVLPSYQNIRNFAVKPVYQTSEPSDLFNTVSKRRRRQTVESVNFVVGEESPCPNFGYCNGPLDPITSYRVRVRAFTENGLYTDTPWSDVVTTKFDPWWFIYALIPYIIIILIIAFLMCLCTCIARDRKKPQQQQAPRIVKASSPDQDANVNASNNVQAASTSQEHLTPVTLPPKRCPTSRPVALVKFGEHVRKMSTRNGDSFAKEYEDLSFIGDATAKTTGALSQNVDKNRYGNIIPFDFNRVRLDKDEDYINASLVSGFNGDNEYIAAQGPQANSVNDFWQMVWEQNVSVIAAVGSCVEKGRVKFAQYWPSDSTPITFGDVTINKVSEREEANQGYIIRDVCLESGSEVRAVRLFQFTSWPFHGVPKKSDQILHFIRSVRSHLPQNAGPLVVHCGAGIGRTGVFVALDILTQQIALDEEYIDVFGTVATKREERTNMVQTELQYEFIHRALLDILEGRVTGPNWTLKSKHRVSIDSDQRIENDIADASL